MNRTAKLIQQLGGTTAVARLCQIKPPSVCRWKQTNRIPQAREQFLRVLRPDLFRKQRR